jgi:hypothetical protein
MDSSVSRDGAVAKSPATCIAYGLQAAKDEQRAGDVAMRSALCLETVNELGTTRNLMLETVVLYASSSLSTAHQAPV